MPINKESIPIRKECFENLQNRGFLAKKETSQNVFMGAHIKWKSQPLYRIPIEIYTDSQNIATEEFRKTLKKPHLSFKKWGFKISLP